MKIKLLFTALLLCVSIMGCKDKDDDIIYEEAIVKKQEGADTCNAFMIVKGKGDDMKKKWYKPENLPSKFQVDGLNIFINYTVSKKVHNCGFRGYKPIIVINRIKKK